MGIARASAEEAGRDPAALKPIVCAPAFISDDMAKAREQTRWFPAMVSNHVMDLLQRYPEDQLPPALYEYVKRREFYDYKDHSRVGAKHGEFVDDETCDRFSILGTPDDHVAEAEAPRGDRRRALEHLPHDRGPGADPRDLRQRDHAGAAKRRRGDVAPFMGPDEVRPLQVPRCGRVVGPRCLDWS